MSLSDYLAAKYLTADPPSKPTKKRKRHAPTSTSSGLVIADDDASTSWNTPTNPDDPDDDPLTLSASTADFRRAKTSSWRTIGAPAPTNSDQSAADAILAQTAAESASRALTDDAPQIVSRSPSPDVAKMESGAHAGLQTAAQVTAAMATRRAAERARFDAASGATDAATHETIYRDASGRIINVAMKRAEARRKAEDEARRLAAGKEALGGDVQRSAREERGRALEEARFMGVARHADDVELNEELKVEERWNDPAAGFLTERRKKVSRSGRPLYKGAAPPNRYGVRPGYRWDGVDRGNGFEGEWFKARNQVKRREGLEYAWQMDE